MSYIVEIEMVNKMVTRNMSFDLQEVDREIDEKIRVLQKELNQLKRARRARRAKARVRYFAKQYLNTI